MNKFSADATYDEGALNSAIANATDFYNLNILPAWTSKHVDDAYAKDMYNRHYFVKDYPSTSNIKYVYDPNLVPAGRAHHRRRGRSEISYRAVDGLPLSRLLVHELTHTQVPYFYRTYTQDDADTLTGAYGFDPEFIKEMYRRDGAVAGENTHLDEAAAVNREFRHILFNRYNDEFGRYPTLDEYKAYVHALPLDTVKDIYVNGATGNGYVGNRLLKEQMNIISDFWKNNPITPNTDLEEHGKLLQDAKRRAEEAKDAFLNTERLEKARDAWENVARTDQVPKMYVNGSGYDTKTAEFKKMKITDNFKRGFLQKVAERDRVAPDIRDSKRLNEVLPEVATTLPERFAEDPWMSLKNPFRVKNGWGNFWKSDGKGNNRLRLNPYLGAIHNPNYEDLPEDMSDAVMFDDFQNGIRAGILKIRSALKPKNRAGAPTVQPTPLSVAVALGLKPIEQLTATNGHFDDYPAEHFAHDISGLYPESASNFMDYEIYDVTDDTVKNIARLWLNNVAANGSTIPDTVIDKAIEAANTQYELSDDEYNAIHKKYLETLPIKETPWWVDELMAEYGVTADQDAVADENNPAVAAGAQQENPQPQDTVAQTVVQDQKMQVPEATAGSVADGTASPGAEGSWISRNGMGVAGGSLAALAALLYLTNRRKKKVSEKTAGLSDDGTHFKLDPGETVGAVINEWKSRHPDSDVSVEDVVRANGGIPAQRYLAGKKYKFPTADDIADNRKHQNSDNNKQETTEKGIVDSVSDWLNRKTPAGTLARDVLRTQINRAARSIGLIDDDKAIFPGSIIDHLSSDQEQWLRYAIQAKNGGNVVPEGRFGGVRAGSGKYQDDYLTYVHPGFKYSFFPSTDLEGPWYDLASSDISNKLRTASWRDIGVPNQIEYMLGDWGWTTDEDGNIVVNDVYDFNTGEGDKDHGSYTGIRQHAGRYASSDVEPDSQKTRFQINLGKPEDWDRFDVDKFHEFNEPYRKDFPKAFYYTDEPGAKPDDNPLSLNAGLGGAGLTAAILAATYGSSKRSKERELEESGIARGSNEFDHEMKKWRRNKLLLSVIETALAGVASSAVPAALKIPV